MNDSSSRSISKPRQRWLLGLFLLPALSACGSDGAATTAPLECFDSTYATLQQSIFEAKGCTQSVCHGESMQGGLDLRAESSHAALVRTPSSIDPSMERVFPGDQDLSVLYLKLQAGVQGTDLGPLGQAMPVDADPLSPEELEAVRLWIRGGARAEGVVKGTLERLACEGTFEAQPNKITPLPAPEPDQGLQFYSGAWSLPAESEDEVCFVTYYDVSDEVPADAKVPCGELAPGRECFAFRRSELAQDGQSHHSITSIYTPESDPNGGEWFGWECLGGERNGEACDPLDDQCGERSACATPVQSTLACIGYFYGPSDFDFGAGATGDSLTRKRLITAQESTFIEEPLSGVYALLPLKGFVVWNSHAFNLTLTDTTVEQWINLTFAPRSERRWEREQIFASAEIFGMGTIAPFEKNEVCATFTLPQHTRLMTLTSHFHQRGDLFRMWLPPNDRCHGTLSCAVPSKAPDYESRLYSDPVEESYDPPRSLDGAATAERTIKMCARYDNGADDASEVKRNSIRPDSPSCSNEFAHCGCTPSERACLGGDQQGALCGGDDATCGAGGLCDACPLVGGITTDDEMFVAFGSYYVEAP
ncbi:MAG: hypothetical protein WCE62_07595 [Polyangiales bacterium]